MHTCWHAHMGWACPNLFFWESPFGTAGPAHSGTYWHKNGGEEVIYNRVEELLRVEELQLWDANTYGVALRTTVYTPELPSHRRVEQIACGPNESWETKWSQPGPKPLQTRCQHERGP
jgi:hypothetical protein